MYRTIGIAGLAVLLVGTVGCGGGESFPTVTGTVTLNNTPLEEGDILFVPVDGVKGPMPGKIQAGRFEFKAPLGKNRVEITSSRIVPGGAKGASGEPVAEETIPEEYHGPKSKLDADVTPSGPNTFEFKLVGKRR